MDLSQLGPDSDVERGIGISQILLEDEKGKSPRTVGRKQEERLLGRQPMVW